MSDEYCVKCGNSGQIYETGERCTCIRGRGEYDSVMTTCLALPEQYRGNVFNTELLPRDLGDYYPKYMDELYSGISSMSLSNINVFLSAPTKHGKTFLAYACIENLYRRGMDIFPLFDILELRRFIMLNDNGKRIPELEEAGIEVSTMYTTPYLFIKLTTDFSFAAFDTLKLVMDRRLRRTGGVTIILSDLPWSYVAASDSKGVFKALLGDGSFGTILNKTFFVKGGEGVD